MCVLSNQVCEMRGLANWCADTARDNIPAGMWRRAVAKLHDGAQHVTTATPVSHKSKHCHS